MKSQIALHCTKVQVVRLNLELSMYQTSLFLEENVRDFVALIFYSIFRVHKSNESCL